MPRDTRTDEIVIMESDDTVRSVEEAGDGYTAWGYDGMATGYTAEDVAQLRADWNETDVDVDYWG